MRCNVILGGLIALVLGLPAAAQNADGEAIRAFRDNGRFGFETYSSRVVIPARYDWVGEFLGEDTVNVQIGNRYGVIDNTGRQIVPVAYDYAEQCQLGQARIYLDGKVGLFDCASGSILLNPTYAYLSQPSPSGRFAANQGARYGAIDRTGRVVVPFEYGILSVTNEGLFRVFRSGSYRWLTPDGSPLFPNDQMFTSTPAGHLIFSQGNNRYGVMTLDNRMLVPFEYRSIRCDETFCYLRRESRDEPELRDARTLRPARPTRISGLEFNEMGLAVFEGENEKFGVRDRAGRDILPAVYTVDPRRDERFIFRPGYIAAVRDGFWGVTDLQGREIIPFRYHHAMSHCERNVSPFADLNERPTVVDTRCNGAKSGQGVLNRQGEWLIAPGTHQGLGAILSDGRGGQVIRFTRAGKQGVFDLINRREVVPAVHQSVVAESEHALFENPGQPFMGLQVYATGRRYLSPNHAFRAYRSDMQTLFVERGELRGLADMNGALTTRIEYSEFWVDRENNFYPVTRGGRLGFIDRNGAVRIPFNFDAVGLGTQWPSGLDQEFFQNGFAYVPQRGRKVLIDLNGRVVARQSDFGPGPAPAHVRAVRFGQIVGWVAEYPRSSGEGKHRRLILNGVLYEAAGGDLGPNDIPAEFSEGLMAVRRGGRFGYLDRTGTMAIAPRFDHAGSFQSGLAPVQVDGQWKLINRKGDIVGFLSQRLALAVNGVQLE